MNDELIRQLLADPEKLIAKQPFTRGCEPYLVSEDGKTVAVNGTITARPPRFKKVVVSQERFMKELDPNSHDILFDDNIPTLCIKINNGDYKDIVFTKQAVPMQKIIKNKQVLHLTGHKMQFTLVDTEPTQKQQMDFMTFKQYWDLRNQDGMKTKMVDTQKSYGDAGLLYYFDLNGRVKSRLLSFADGYVLCPHNDQNGDRILECVYYYNEDVEYIDCYDSKYMYRITRDNNATSDDDGWTYHTPIEHGFDEIPLITKRGEVAWNDVETLIESYEILYNVFAAIQRRHGWGLLYIKGKFKDAAQKIAGSYILNDTSIDGKGDAKFLTPPDPQGYLETLRLLFDTIQMGSSTTFLLPKDINYSGDISGIAIKLVQNLDINRALRDVIDWQNVADKMVRLFKQGLAKELVSSGVNQTAVTDFEQLNINAKFKVWQPMNDYEYNQMLTILSGAGLLSKETGIQKNTESAPDESFRISKQLEKEKEAQQQQQSTEVIKSNVNINE